MGLNTTNGWWFGRLKLARLFDKPPHVKDGGNENSPADPPAAVNHCSSNSRCIDPMQVVLDWWFRMLG